MKRKIESIVIHCAATKNGQAFEIKQIDDMHKARGFKRDSQFVRTYNPELKHVGYHRFIRIDGVVQSGRSLEEVGAHVAGFNSKTIGVCMAGTDKFTQAQFDALKSLIFSLLSEITNKALPVIEDLGLQKVLKDYNISIKGHRDYSPDLNKDGKITSNEFIKICPGFDVATLVRNDFVPDDINLIK